MSGSKIQKKKLKSPNLSREAHRKALPHLYTISLTKRIKISRFKGP